MDPAAQHFNAVVPVRFRSNEIMRETRISRRGLLWSLDIVHNRIASRFSQLSLSESNHFSS